MKIGEFADQVSIRSISQLLAAIHDCSKNLLGILESAKMRALRTKNVLACQHALRAYMLKCLRVFRAYVLTCLRALRAYVLTCLHALRAYALTCQRALRAYVLTC